MTESSPLSNRIPIKFYLQPYYTGSDNINAVEKADTEGVKHKYIYGISSGTGIDQHGERMTENCIKSFMDQFNSGNISAI